VPNRYLTASSLRMSRSFIRTASKTISSLAKSG
jgi:hypothetical protein